MQLSMISFKLVAISMLGTHLVTQAIAMPVNTQRSNAIEARGLLSGIVIGSVGSHYYHKSKEETAEEEAEEYEKDNQETATKKSRRPVVEEE